MPALRGRFVWHELATTDPDAATEFYRAVIGWKLLPWEHDPSYRIWTMGGPRVGGLMRLPEESRRSGTQPHWVTYIGIPDVDAAARQATSLGGRISVPPQTLPHVGRFAVLEDPQGARFVVYKPEGESSRPGEPARGDFSWHELRTTDYRAAWNFYHALFGWEATESFSVPGIGVYWMFGWDGQSVGGIYNKPPTVPVAAWLPYVLVPNVEVAAAAVTQAGGRILSGPMEVPGGDWIAQCQDPQGAAFAVHARPTPRVSRSSPKQPNGRKPAKKAKKKVTGKKPAAKKKPKARKRRR